MTSFEFGNLRAGSFFSLALNMRKNITDGMPAIERYQH